MAPNHPRYGKDIDAVSKPSAPGELMSLEEQLRLVTEERDRWKQIAGNFEKEARLAEERLNDCLERLERAARGQLQA